MGEMWVWVGRIGMEDIGNFQISGIGDCMETDVIGCDKGITGLGIIFLDILYLRDSCDIKRIMSTPCYTIKDI